MKTVNMPLGQKNIFQDDRYLGAQGCFIDYNLDTPEAPTVNSANEICAVFVKNDSGSTLDAGKGVVFKAGAIGRTIGGYHSANGRCDGVIDPFLGASATVAVGDYFWLVIAGPIDVAVGAGNLADNSVVQTLASGVFGTGTAGTNTVGHSGISAEAGTSGNRARVFFGNAFSAVKYC